MKKILGLIALTIVFTCCDIGPRSTSAETVIVDGAFAQDVVKKHEHREGGIEYHIFYQREGGIYVVNHTKELLEVELLQLQIDSLKLK